MTKQKQRPHALPSATRTGKLHPHTLDFCQAFQPEGLVVDSFGNLIFADTLNNVVLSINIASGTPTVAAGDAPQDQYTAPAGYNGDNILANTAELNAPQDVAVDTAGNIYIADTLNYRIRKVTLATGIITTVAGNGTQGDTGDGAAATGAEITPYGLATDLAGDLFITPGTGGIVRKVDASGNITTFAGGGGTGAISGPASTGAIANAFFPAPISPETSSFPPASRSWPPAPDGLLQFPSEPIGSTSTALSATVENTGDTNLSIESTGTSITGTDAGDFALAGSSCGTALAPGKTCAISVTFKPTASGPRTARSVSVGSNAAGSPATILLQGSSSTATAPIASLSPTTLSFPATTVGSTAAAHLHHPLQHRQRRPQHIRHHPHRDQPNRLRHHHHLRLHTRRRRNLHHLRHLHPSRCCQLHCLHLRRLTTPPVSPQTATLSGTGTAAPAPIASLSPTTLSFPNTTVGSTAAAMSTTLSNTGNAVLKHIRHHPHRNQSYRLRHHHHLRLHTRRRRNLHHLRHLHPSRCCQLHCLHLRS